VKHLWLLALLIATGAQANIGKVTELQGAAVEIKRKNQTIKAVKDTVIEANDTVSVGSNTRLTITFADNSTAKITENSKLVIDDFVYDPKGSSKSAMRVTLGTVRMASGGIAKQNSESVNIKTPTAAIAVRGTDFAMTVSELGESTVVLLPTCKDDRDATKVELPGNCVCGAIDVVTQAGKVSMESPFFATHVATAQEAPLVPVRVDQRKDSNRDKSKTNPDEQRTARDNNKEAVDKRKTASDDDTINRSLAGQLGDTKTATAAQAASNPCWPFTSCGNEKGYNWYEHADPLRGNIINIRTLETTDTTTYNISVNNVDISQRQVGSGANGNVVTVRQWNR